MLIVSKTRMRDDHVCVGGHDLDEKMCSVRLLQPDGNNMPASTRFEIGHVWDLDYQPAPNVRPPHLEDVLVDPNGARHIETIQSLGAFLRERVSIWTETRACARTSRYRANRSQRELLCAVVVRANVSLMKTEQ
jgi:hypothetical protein